jgi:hypothetical protein
MLRMCVYMHSRFVENHPIRILEDGPLISKVVLSHICHVSYKSAVVPTSGKRCGAIALSDLIRVLHTNTVT